MKEEVKDLIAFIFVMLIIIGIILSVVYITIYSVHQEKQFRNYCHEQNGFLAEEDSRCIIGDYKIIEFVNFTKSQGEKNETINK